MLRKEFIKNTSIATAGITILNFPVFGKNAPSNQIVVAVMGVNGRGGYHAEAFSKLANVEVGYICDVEDNAIAKCMKSFATADKKPTVLKDIRELLNKKHFDALTIATTAHSHNPAT